MTEYAAHRTPKGRMSMDPTRWRVARVDWVGLVSCHKTWGVFPAGSMDVIEVYFDHEEALNRATRFAMFAVVPPVGTLDVLRDNTNGEAE